MGPVTPVPVALAPPSAAVASVNPVIPDVAKAPVTLAPSLPSPFPYGGGVLSPGIPEHGGGAAIGFPKQQYQ